MAGYGIGKRNDEVYDFILGFAFEHGRLPTLREMSESMGIDRKSIDYYIKMLHEKGMIVYEERGRYTVPALQYTVKDIGGQTNGKTKNHVRRKRSNA